MALPRNVITSVGAAGLEALLIPLGVEVLRLHYMIAVMSAMLLGTTFSFVTNKLWAFEARRGNTTAQFGKGILLAGGSFAWNSLLIWSLTEYAGLHYFLSYLVSGVAVFGLWNYPGTRWFVFSDGHRGAGRHVVEGPRGTVPPG